MRRATLLLPIILVCSCGWPEPASRSEFLLDTVCSVTVYGAVDSSVLDAVFTRTAAVNGAMSRYDEASDVSAVNRAAGEDSVVVGPDTFFVVGRALSFAAESGGRFDPTIGPLSLLWNIGSGNERVPEPGEIGTAVSLIGYGDVAMDTATGGIRLLRPGMQLDLGGIAKGYAVDEAGRILRENGAAAALVDFGGNLLTVGSKPDGSPWRIGLQRPNSPRGESFCRILRRGEFALATSGTYERYFEADGRIYHHLLDPSTGYPIDNGLVSATALTTAAVDADALSTTLFALGLEAGLAYAENRPDTEAVFLTSDNVVRITSGLAEEFELLDDTYSLIR